MRANSSTSSVVNVRVNVARAPTDGGFQPIASRKRHRPVINVSDPQVVDLPFARRRRKLVSMVTRIRHRLPGLLLAVVMAGCVGAGPGAGGSPAGSLPDPTTDAATNEPAGRGPTTPGESRASAGPLPSGGDEGGFLDRPWATAELTDVATGESFTVAGIAASGQTVFVETMAIWCSNCLSQQRQATAAMDRLDRARVVWVALDVDPAERAEDLAVYQDLHGFGFRYAIASRDVARALAADFGDQVLSPPATPIIVVAADGGVTLTHFGPKSADELVALAAQHGA
jgi:hypothetical protein